MRAFLDTSALVALALQRDRHHRNAKSWLASRSADDQLITSDYVLDETLTRLRKVAGHAVAVQVGRAIRGSALARLLRVEAEDLDVAWEAFARFSDQDLSFTDCTIYAMAKRLRIEAVFTFDRDFERLGLKRLP